MQGEQGIPSKPFQFGSDKGGGGPPEKLIFHISLERQKREQVKGTGRRPLLKQQKEIKNQEQGKERKPRQKEY